MSLHQNILGLIDPRGKRGRAAMIWMKLLHQGSVSADDFRRARAFGKTKNFVAPRGATSRRRPRRSPAPDPDPGLPHASRRTGGRDMPLAD